MAVAIRKNLQLSEGQEFTLAQMIAVVLHLLVFAVLSFIPSPTVQQIPVRVLSIKLGAEGEAKQGVMPEPDAADNEGGMTVPASVLQLPEVDIAENADKNPELEALMEAELTKMFTDAEAELAAAPEPVAASQPQPAPVSKPAQPLVRKPAAPAPAPKKFVREDAASGSRYGTSRTAQEERIKRYTQQLSLWFKSKVVYPEVARRQSLTGRGELKITIDRAGRVLGIEMHRSTGHRVLDDAALQTAAEVNPMPPVPAWYQPGQTRLQFIFPVNYREDRQS